ncbi:MAG: NADH-quinone oxidoreductase subunit L [Myxococcales bacterium]|nr:NADH-quinone oxidoreductase subunit L [Myxococcales bacterium]
MDILGSLRELVLASGEHGEHAAPLAVQAVKSAGYLWLIPFFPLLGSAINAALGLRIQRRYGRKWCSHLAIGAMVASFLVAVVALVDMLGQPAERRYLVDHLWNMLTAGDVQVNLSFALDPLSMVMTLIITFVGALIHVYSQGYMADDPSYWRFFCYLNLFVFSMLLLVMGDNFVLMFFGWEGVGLCSYLLIGFWYTDLEKAKAGVKAFVTNRFGDFGFVLGLFLLFWALGGGWVTKQGVTPEHESRWALADPGYQPKAKDGTFYEADRALTPASPPATYDEVAKLGTPSGWSQGPAVAVRGGVRVGPTLSFRELRDQIAVESTGVRQRLTSMTVLGVPVLALIAILLFVGATAKSAQLPLHVWLPDAMAGPTPVSALIHAATMVTAGVYLVARLNFIYALSPAAMTVVAVTGAVTAAFAATIGFVQNDIKKVLAYSTVSQLGFMFIGVGVGAYWAGIYHLLTHAFFKACLFLGSGSVILGCHHEQDMRKMGGLKKYMPLTAKTYWYACVAIAGFPIANGFFSKDEILWKAFTAGDNLLDPAIGKAIWLLGWLTALGTSFYMWRSYYMTFTGEYRGAGHGHGTFEAPAPGHAPPAAAAAHKLLPRLATHSLGAAHAGTFDQDVAMASVQVAGAGGGHAAAHGHSDAHGHPGGPPQESPRSMTWVLITLAVGCGATVLLGLFAPLGIVPPLEHWLSPSLLPAEALVHSRLSPDAGNHGLEWLLIGASVGVAFGGWLLARAFYKDAKSAVPVRLAASYPRLHRTVFNKYYVDELYQRTVLAASMVFARACSAFDRVVVDGVVNGAAAVGRFLCNIDGAIDKHLVDGAVNLFADATLRAGKQLRRVQSGRIQHYLYAALAGALVVVGINLLLR